MTPPAIRSGDFSALAADYSAHRPAYAPDVADAVVALVQSPPTEITAADVGAGTGIWSRMLADRVSHVIAIEPNAEMRRCAAADCAGRNIDVRDGSGEATGLKDSSVALVTMASSFHWVDFDRGLAEFHRVLTPGGYFVALWNPRVIADSGLFREVENYITSLKPDLKRKSSGNSAFTESLSDRLSDHVLFEPPVYFEATHVEQQSRERYLGLWRSVNDVQAQLGPDKWAEFMAYVEARTADLDRLDVTYRTRAWCMRKRDRG